jgi:hypothetical protein
LNRAVCAVNFEDKESQAAERANDRSISPVDAIPLPRQRNSHFACYGVKGWLRMQLPFLPEVVMIRSSRLFSTARLLAIGAAFVVFVPGVRAVIPEPKHPTNTTPIEQMRLGKLAVGADPKNKEVLSDLAKWLSYRLVFPPFNGKPLPKKPIVPEDLETLLREADRYFSIPKNDGKTLDANQMEYGRELGKCMSDELLFVMSETPEKLEKVNAARMLALAGKLPCEELADTYLKIIKEEQFPDEIKLFAFQGLRNLLAIPDRLNPANHFIKINVKRNLLAEINEELEKIILRQFPPNLPLDRALVIQFIRREAVKAMAQFKHALLYDPAGKEIVGKPIWTLLRVARNDPTALPGHNYHPMERIEALIGVCTMRPDKNVNCDAVAYLVNETLLEMADWQGREKSELAKDPRNKPIVPWKLVGYRLDDAMKQWTANAAKVPSERNPKYAIELADMSSKKMFGKLMVDGVNAVPDYRSLTNWRSDRKPKIAQVIADDMTTAYQVQ